MSTELGALPTGETAAPPPAPEAEQHKSAGLEQASESQQSEEQGTEGAEPRDEGKRKRGIGERALEYRNQARDTQRINDRLIAVLERSLGGKAPTVEGSAGPPRREDFGSHEDYLEARADFQVAQAVRDAERRVNVRRQREAIEALDSTWEERLEEAADEDDALNGYVDRVGPRISQFAGVAIKESESGIDVLRYLGENQAELKKLSKMSDAAQVREIGKIEARLEMKGELAKRQSKAPPPIEPVGSGKGSSSTDPAQMSMAEYEAWRKKQGARWAR